MKKFQLGIGEYLTGLLYATLGFMVSLLSPILGLPMVFGMAGRLGGSGRVFAYLAVGATTGIVSSTLGGFISGFTGGLGFIGTLISWAVNGFVIVLLVGIILKSFKAG